MSQSKKQDYLFKIGNSTHIATLEKLVRELKMWEQSPGEKITGKNLKEVKKVHQVIKTLKPNNEESNGKFYSAVKKYMNQSDVKIYNTGYRRHGKDVMQILFKRKMNRDQINTVGNELSHMFDPDGSTIETVVRADRWHYMKSNELGEDYDFSEHPDYNGGKNLDFNEFDMTGFYITLGWKPKSRGGYSDNNDCLYNCLKRILGNSLIWKTPEELRAFLKIPLNTLIDISNLEKIEKKLNIPIFCTGDYSYFSKLKSTCKAVHIKLANEHYYCDDDKIKQIDIKKFISIYERKPLIYDKGTFMAFDGKKTMKITKEFRNEIYNWKTPYILVGKLDKKLSLDENYKLFVNMADTLKRETNGLINMYKTGSLKITALTLFNKMTKHIIKPDPITNQTEIDFIRFCRGACYFTTYNYSGPVYKGDVKSMYPSIMQSKQIFPIKEGELRNISEFKPEFFEFGIYRAIVKSTTKLFSVNRYNYYTHIDLTRAKELNLPIELIQDGQANCLHYSRDKCLTGFELFGSYVDLLYSLKAKKIYGAKEILNILWGALTEKTQVKKENKVGDIKDIPANTTINYIKPSMYDETVTLVSYSHLNRFYKHGFARVSPFLIAKGRKVISEIMEPYESILVRCHTDGVMFSAQPVGIKYSNEIGGFADEGFYPQVSIDKSGVVLLKQAT